MKQFITQSFAALVITPLLSLKQLIASKSLMEQYKSIINDGVIVSKLRTSASPALKAAAIISEQHHEKYDGSGYPYGRKNRKSTYLQ